MAGNTGYKSFANLELYYPDDNSAAGEVKANVFGTVGYISPVYDAATCIPSARYYNTLRTLSVNKNDCGSGFVGSSVTMTSDANMFTSTISVADANAQADSYLSANAQTYANNVGTCIASGDTTPPTPPTYIIASEFNQHTIELFWGGASDNVGVVSYNVYRNYTLIYIATPNQFYYDEELGNGFYTYNVVAVDAAGNESILSEDSNSISLQNSPYAIQ